MILSTSEVIDFLAGKSPLNAFIIGFAGAGKTYLIKKLIPKLVGKMYIELYADRDYSYFEYKTLIKKFNAETINIEKGYPFKSNSSIKPVKIMFKGNNSLHRLAIVDDVNRLIEDAEELINNLAENKYNYILLFLRTPENMQSLIRHTDYLIISSSDKILGREMNLNINLNQLPKPFTWLMIKSLDLL